MMKPNLSSTTLLRHADVAWLIALGFVGGYVLLHPVSMVIFGLLDPRAAIQNPIHAGWEQILHSFHRGMTAMGFAFGAVGALLAGAFAWHRRRIASQRDQLARQLEASDRNRAELEKQTELLRTKYREVANLEHANRHNTEFVVHDFKTNLACVIGFARLLLEKNERQSDAETRTALERILRQSSGMLSAVNDLLELARFREVVRLRKEETSVRDLLTDAAGDFSLPGQAERVCVESKHLDRETLYCDRRLLKRVLTNLISNALRHNPPETRAVVGAEIAYEHTQIIFHCRDDGRGLSSISSDRIAHILKKWDAESGGDGGSGDSRSLGLRFCTSAVEAHGGMMWCESVVGKGSCFYFCIPLGTRGEEQWMAQTEA